MRIFRKLPIALVLIAAGISLAGNAEPSRRATIEDARGIKSVVTELKCSFPQPYWFVTDSVYLTNALIVKMPGWAVAVPIDRLRTIDATGKPAEVTYDWHNRPQTLSGDLVGTFEYLAKTKRFTLDASKLRRLAFDRAPDDDIWNKMWNEPRRHGCPASILLTNGGQVTLTAVQLAVEHWLLRYTVAGDPAPGARSTISTSNVQFMRGESDALFKFDSIRKLEFGPDDSVTITLKTGALISGKLFKSGRDGCILGWTGQFDQGLVFVDRADVRAVDLADSVSADKKKE